MAEARCENIAMEWKRRSTKQVRQVMVEWRKQDCCALACVMVVLLVLRVEGVRYMKDHAAADDIADDIADDDVDPACTVLCDRIVEVSFARV